MLEKESRTDSQNFIRLLYTGTNVAPPDQLSGSTAGEGILFTPVSTYSSQLLDLGVTDPAHPVFSKDIEVFFEENKDDVVSSGPEESPKLLISMFFSTNKDKDNDE